MNKSVKKAVIGLSILSISFSSYLLTETFRSKTNKFVKQEYIIVQAEKNIEKIRKGKFIINFINKSCQPIKNTDISVNQLSHNFKFGGALSLYNDKNYDKYKEEFLSLFNYATFETALKWKILEPTINEYDYGWADNLLDWCKKNNIAVKGHAVLWGNKKWGLPDWLQHLDNKKVEQRIDLHIKSIMNRYKDYIKIWDIINEPLTDEFFGNIAKDYAENALITARKIDPKAKLVINEFGVIHNRAKRERFYTYLNKLKEKNIPFDIIVYKHMNQSMVFSILMRLPIL